MNGIRKIGRSSETDPGGRINEPGDETETTPVEDVAKPSESRPTQDRYDEAGVTQNPHPNYTKLGTMESPVTHEKHNSEEENEEPETNPENEQ